MSQSAVDKNDPIPRYLQVQQILERSIRSGLYRPGSRLPGERELALKLQVSQMTVNRAMVALESAGLLRREVGKGTFVPDDVQFPSSAFARIGFAIPFSAQNVGQDFYLSGLMKGIQKAVTNEPVSLSILETPEKHIYSHLANAPAEGFLMIDVLDRSLDDVHRLAEDGKRIILLSVDRAPMHLPFVDSDNYGGATLAMEHLIGLGHRQIGGIFAYIESSNSRHRHQAYVDALAAHQLTLDPEAVIILDHQDSVSNVMYERIQALLKQSRPTAILCGGYYIALEAIRAIQDFGLSVPGDISVVGFDDPVSARYLTPSLTTVSQPLEEMGYTAAKHLSRWLLSGEMPPQITILPATLVERESTKLAINTVTRVMP